MIVDVIVDLLRAYLIILLVRIVLTWIPISPFSPFAKVVGWLGAITDPLLRPMRRLIPPLRLGAMALDLSPIILIVCLEVVISIIAGGATF